MSSRIASGPCQTVRNDLGVTAIGNGAFVALIASTNTEVIMMEIVETSGFDFILGIGPAGSETSVYNIPANQSKLIPFHVSKGTRISAKSYAGTIAAGVIILNLFY